MWSPYDSGAEWVGQLPFDPTIDPIIEHAATRIAPAPFVRGIWRQDLVHWGKRRIEFLVLVDTWGISQAELAADILVPMDLIFTPIRRERNVAVDYAIYPQSQTVLDTSGFRRIR